MPTAETKNAAEPRPDPDLLPVLQKGDPDDLGVLVDYITDSGKGRVSLDNLTMSKLVAATAKEKFSKADRLLLAHELQLFGGNSVANLARGGKGVLYAEIVRDVASRLRATYEDDASTFEVEDAILEALVRKAWDKMSDEEREQFAKDAGVNKAKGLGEAALLAIIVAIRAGGFASYQFAAVIASAVARQILGRGLAFGALAPMMKGMAVLAGPIGWIMTAIWAGYDLASPGYRVTVPCVIQVIYMRRKALVQ